MNTACVVKVGGTLLESEQDMAAFFAQCAELEQYLPVIVHGGGVQVAALLAQLSLTSEKLNGLRVTPKEHMPYVCGCLAGTLNKQLVASALMANLRAVGLSILDGNMVKAKQVSAELGQVGTPTEFDNSLLAQLLSHDWLPIISSIGMDAGGQLLNVNADHAAAAVAQALQCPLILLSDVPAVLDKNNQRITEITPLLLPELVNNGTITDGMLVKVNTAIDTAKQSGRAVIIAGWRDSLSTILAGQAGTHIIA